MNYVHMFKQLCVHTLQQENLSLFGIIQSPHLKQPDSNHKKSICMKLHPRNTHTHTHTQ